MFFHRNGSHSSLFFVDVLLNLAVALPDSHCCMIFTWLGDSEPCHLRSRTLRTSLHL